MEDSGKGGDGATADVGTRMELGLAFEVFRLWLPASLAAVADWTRPIVFNLYVSSNIKASVLTESEATLEEDAVGLAIMSLNLILFATINTVFDIRGVSQSVVMLIMRT